MNMAKDNRRLVLVCAAAGIVGGCFSSVVFSLTASAQASSATASVVRAKRLDIVDDEGIVRAWIGMEPGSGANGAPQKTPALTIGRPDQRHVVLADDGIMLLGPTGSGHELRAQFGEWTQVRAPVGVAANPRWGIAVYDASGNAKYSWVTQ
jgi:hypothetical protein